jgi:hypothetical protein
MKPSRTSPGRRACVAALAVLSAAAFAGCAGYRLGSMIPPDIRTIYISTFENKTDEPLIEGEATRRVIRQVQEDGTLRVVRTREEADAILTGTLQAYNLTPIAYSEQERARPNQYRIALRASFAMTAAATGKVLVEDSDAYGEAVIQVTGDLSSAKRSGLPTAAEDLAHRIVRRMIEMW